MDKSQLDLFAFFAQEYTDMQNKSKSSNEINDINDSSANNDADDIPDTDTEEEEESAEIPVEEYEEDIEDTDEEAREEDNAAEDGKDSSSTNEFSLTLEEALEEAGTQGSQNSEEDNDKNKDKEVNHRILQDFGNKIAGARKDVYGMYQLSLETLDRENTLGSLAKAWPAPDYDKLLAGGIAPWKVSAIRALRETIPSRSRKGYRTYWGKALIEKRKLAIDILKDEFTADTFVTKLKANAESNERYKDEDFADQDCGAFEKWTYTLHQYMLYNELGHDNDLSKYYVANNCNHVRSNPTGYALLKKCPDYQTTRLYEDRINYRGYYAQGQTHFGVITSGQDSFKELIPFVQEELVKDNLKGNNRGGAGKKELSIDDFHIGYQTDKNYTIYAYKKNYSITIKDNFETYQEAEQYLNDNFNDVSATFNKLAEFPSERTSDNEERTGNVYEHGDITPEKFQETFGFYGVQFGNWVEGKLRQDFVNKTYDALLDLSTAIGVPPKALSLNGTLGLSFGGRGRGGKNAALAHYEPYTTCINLTKMKGAGCLAHEWFHALDNYLGRKEGKSMATELFSVGYPLLYGKKLYGDTDFFYGTQPTGKNLSQGVVDALCGNLYMILRKTNIQERSRKYDGARSKPYWGTTIEIMARTFEAYVKHTLKEKGIKNDFLVNIKEEQSWNNESKYPYVYPKASEMEMVCDAFDGLFNNIHTKTLENGNVEMFSCSKHDTLGSQIEACKPVSRHNLTREQSALLRFSQEELGLPIAYYDGPETLHGKFSPDEGIMYLNRNAEMPLEWTFYHESFHAMKYQEPALYKDLLNFVEKESIITKEQINAYRTEHKAKDLPDDVVKEEMLANAFADKKTGNSVLYSMTNKEPNLAVRFMRFTKNVAKKAVNFFKKEPECKGVLSASQFEAFSARLDDIAEQMTVKGKKPLSKASNILLPDGSAITPDDAKGISLTPCYPFSDTPEKQKKFDIHIATELLKHYPRNIVQDVLKNQSPLRNQKDYISSVFSTIDKARVCTQSR